MATMLASASCPLPASAPTPSHLRVDSAAMSSQGETPASTIPRRSFSTTEWRPSLPTPQEDEDSMITTEAAGHLEARTEGDITPRWMAVNGLNRSAFLKSASSSTAMDRPLSGSSTSSTKSSDHVYEPISPTSVPFLPKQTLKGCAVTVELQFDCFVIAVSLPGFTMENVQVASKKHGRIHILADKWEQLLPGQVSNEEDDDVVKGSHFERMIDLTHYGRPASEGMTATWTDDVLTIKVPIRDSVERTLSTSPFDRFNTY